jgi:hypothetical protein
MKFVMPPMDAIPYFLRQAVRETERNTFFGQHVSRIHGHFNLLASVDNYVGAQARAGRLKVDEIEKLKGLLMSRFGPGEQPAPKLVQDFRNIAYGTMLSNWWSAIAQTPDIAQAGGLYQAASMARSIAAVLRKDAAWTLEEFGLRNHMIEDLAGTERRSARFARRALDNKLGGFGQMDVFGKSVLMNAAWDRFQRLAKSEKGQKDLARRYADFFGDDMPQLIDDLRAGRKSELTATMIFRELSDVQPMTKLERSQLYLEEPQLRLFYTFKGFAQKQANLLLDRGVNEILHGNKIEGTRFLLRYAAYVGTGTAGALYMQKALTQLLSGLPVNLDFNDVFDGMMRNFGWSSYTGDLVAAGELKKAIVSLAFPPTAMWEAAMKGDKAALVQYLPVLGKPIYKWFLGGAEDEAIRAAKQDKRRAKLDERTVDDWKEAEERAKARREARRQRELERLNAR